MIREPGYDDLYKMDVTYFSTYNIIVTERTIIENR